MAPRDFLFGPAAFWIKDRNRKYRIKTTATKTKIRKISIYKTILL